MIITLKTWYAQKNNIPVSIEGEIIKETPKAVLIKGHGNVFAPVFCMCCGQELTNPVSKFLGIGPTCCEKWGFPRPDRLNDEQLLELREQLKINTSFEEWIPKSVIVEDVSRETVPVEPVLPQNSLTYKNGKFFIKCSFSFNPEIKSIGGGRWDSNEKAWTLPVTPFVVLKIQEIFGDDINYDDKFQSFLQEALTAVEAQSMKTETNIPDHPSKTPSWLHQKQCYRFCEAQQGAGIFMEMGAGKTKVAIDLMANHPGQKHLIICPRGVMKVWPREFEKHSILDFTIIPLTKGTAKDKAKLVKEYNGPFPVVFITTYESSWRKPLDDVLVAQKFDWVVLDESHRIKKPSGKASLTAARIGRSAKRRLALSGTPMSHSPLDIYAQYRFLDPGIFGTNFKNFCDEYAIYGGFENRKVVDYKNVEKLYENVYKIAFRVLTRDVIDLIPTTSIERVFSLDNKTMKVYHQIEKEAIIAAKDENIPIDNVLTQLLRMQQLTSGFLPNEEGTLEVLDYNKLSEFKEVLEDINNNEPIVVFARFKQDLDNIRAAVEESGRTFSEVSGRIDQLEEWKAGKTDVVGVQIQTGGEGEDFTRAHYTIYYSVGFSLKDYEQSMKRTDRPGQKHHAVFIHLIAENTVDEKIMKALSDRKDVVSSILGDYRN